jgi:hypothetical protein
MFLRQKLLRTKQEVADRIALFFEQELTVEKCQNYIRHVKKVK